MTGPATPVIGELTTSPAFSVDQKLTVPSAGGVTHVAIQGDNVDVVAALPSLDGAAQIVYLDPPYGTSRYEQRYTDAVRGARWPEWVAPRFDAAARILADDGLCFVQVSTSALPAARAVSDAAFGANRFVAQIVVERKAPAGLGQHGFMMDVCEFVLVYSGRNRPTNAARKLWEPATQATVGAYDHVLTRKGRVLSKKTVTDQSGSFVVEERDGYQLDRLPVSSRTVDHHRRNLSKVVRTTNAQGVKRFLGHVGPGLFTVTYTPTRGQWAGRPRKLWFHNRRLLVWLSDTARLEQGVLMKSSTVTNLWTGNLYQGLGAEGGVRFPGGKKPLRLLGRLFAMHPNPSALVVDLFAGSGSTGQAVIDANRTEGWSRASVLVTADEADIFDDVCVPRLRGVISGTLPNGRPHPVSPDGLLVARHH